MDKLSSILKYKLPDFVREDHELFVAFVQAYYEWMEQEGQAHHFLQSYRENMDVDRASDAFIDEFMVEFADTFPKTTLIPRNVLLKTIREFYLAKGSEDSFRFIFTVLYNTEIEIIYPREFLQVASGGDYTSDVIAYITGDNWFKLNIDNDDLNASIVGQTSGAQAVIDTILSTFIDGQQIIQLEISSFAGQFTPGETVTLTVDDFVVEEIIYGSVERIQIDNGGTNYRLDDPVTITDTASGQRAKAKIAQLAHGGFETVTITNAGTGYDVGDSIKAEPVLNSAGYGFRAIVRQVGAGGEIERIQVESNGYDYSKKTAGLVSSIGGTGAVLELNGTDIGRIVALEVFEGGINYQSPSNITVNVTSDDGVGATFTPLLGGIFTAPKRFTSQAGFPSNYNRLMDSYLYQQYSYIIGSTVSPHEWLGKVKRIAHPSGTQLFGMLKISNEFDVAVSLPEDIISSFVQTLEYISTVIIGDMVTDAQPRTLIRINSTTMQTGLNVNHLDEMKFLPTFEWTIGDFATLSIDTVSEDHTQIRLREQESSEIVIT